LAKFGGADTLPFDESVLDAVRSATVGILLLQATSRHLKKSLKGHEDSWNGRAGADQAVGD
jgi:hypothetical protein